MAGGIELSLSKLENRQTAILGFFSCSNQQAKEVLTGKFEGIILPL